MNLNFKFINIINLVLKIINIKKLIVLFLTVFIIYSCQRNESNELINIADNYSNIGNFEEAVQTYIIFLRNNPNNRNIDKALFRLAGLYTYQLNDQEKAIKYYQQIIVRHRQSAYFSQTLSSLADIYLDRDYNAVRKAISLLELLVNQVDISDNVWILANLKLANAHLSLKNYEDARSVYKNIIDKLINIPDYKYIVSYSYYKIGISFENENYKKLAKYAFIESEFHSGKSVDSVLSAMMLAEIYEEENDTNNAQIIYKSIIDRLDEDEPLYLIYKSKLNN